MNDTHLQNNIKKTNLSLVSCTIFIQVEVFFYGHAMRPNKILIGFGKGSCFLQHIKL